MSIEDFEGYVDDQLSQIAAGLNSIRPSPNQSLFRYIGLNNKTSWKLLEQTLSDFSLRGALASSLNDPFEQNPCVFDDLVPTLLENMRKSPNFFVENLRTPLSDNEIEKYRSAAYEFLDEEKRTKRIVAFCERSDSPLLWSHYANSYRGACLHFVGGRISRTSPREPSLFGKVQYSDHRPIYPLSLALAQSKFSRENLLSKQPRLHKIESERLLFFWKSTDWAYEKEYRIVYSGTRSADFQFNPESLVSIVVGPKMPEEEVQQLQSLIGRSRMPKLRIRRAEISDSSYNVQIDWGLQR